MADWQYVAKELGNGPKDLHRCKEHALRLGIKIGPPIRLIRYKARKKKEILNYFDRKKKGGHIPKFERPKNLSNYKHIHRHTESKSFSSIVE